MGEWNDPTASPEMMAFFKEAREADARSYAAWRRGDPPPEQSVFEAAKPKHVYQGNRKQRRAQAKGARP